MIYLDDLLRGNDFDHVVAGLARPLRERFAFPSLHQLGVVVPDVEKAAAVLENDGFEPFFVARGAPVFWQEKGRRHRVSDKMGLAYHQGIEIELLEPLQGSDFYHSALDPSGRPVLQHLGFLVEDVDRWGEKLASAGLGVWVRGQLKTGPVKTDFAYMDPLEDDGLIMEFIVWRCFGQRFHPRSAIAHTIGRIQQWTGKRCWSL